MTTAKKRAKKHKGDIILIAVVLLLAIISLLLVFLFRKDGAFVVVSIDGEDVAAYSLSKDMTVTLETGADGNSFNTLIIKDGKAFVSNADCPDGICAAHAPIAFDSESIICIPNRLVLRISVTCPEGLGGLK